ncbi:Os09g0453200 [Oryza sativa Japonica Group]|uniref:Os09g0453200 protein n=1 Tax=Oryza sativa subsp. japonica TaxID=39947 RepID=Q0J1A9_ORYSJ|nr:hypothetical protein OsJ_29600 [Oryza sativa Japonica Group]BAF25256.2 Os09g0453200 [Oryza sativa Japonica Group]|eukprot:NP_001063342.2 Os09g0453200 [Oryza sativa Japonica Group]
MARRGGAWAWAATAAALLWWMAAGAGAVWLEIPPSATKCVSEEIQSNVVVIGDYSVLYEHHLNPTVTVKTVEAATKFLSFCDPEMASPCQGLLEEVRCNHIHLERRAIPISSRFGTPAKVTSPFGDIVHHKQKVSTGQFSFTTAEAGNYLACFSADGRNKRLVVKLNLDWRVGIATKDWDSVAKKEKLEGVELELVKLETSVQAIHENLLLLRSKEANMRDTSEKTNARATWLSIISLIVCIIVSVLQLWHLQQYFRKKKLI